MIREFHSDREIHVFEVAEIVGIHADQDFHYDYISRDMPENDDWLDQWDARIRFVDGHNITVRVSKKDLEKLIAEWKEASA